MTAKSAGEGVFHESLLSTVLTYRLSDFLDIPRVMPISDTLVFQAGTQLAYHLRPDLCDAAACQT